MPTEENLSKREPNSKMIRAKGKVRKNTLLGEKKGKALEVEKSDPWDPMEYFQIKWRPFNRSYIRNEEKSIVFME